MKIDSGRYTTPVTVFILLSIVPAMVMWLAFIGYLVFYILLGYRLAPVDGIIHGFRKMSAAVQVILMLGGPAISTAAGWIWMGIFLSDNDSNRWLRVFTYVATVLLILPVLLLMGRR